MAEQIVLEGMVKLNRILKGLPERVQKKPLQNVFRKATKPLLSEIRAGAPVATGNTRKNARVINGKGANIKIGFKGGGSYMPSYMKAYWSAYGTMENRDPLHRFSEKRKSKTRWRSGGIRPSRFVESAWEKTKDTVTKNINQNIIHDLEAWMKKHAYA